MSKAMIVLEATHVEWGQFLVTPGGGVRQEVRVHEGDECKVVMNINFPATSEVAQGVIRSLQQPQGSLLINTDSIASDMTVALRS